MSTKQSANHPARDLPAPALLDVRQVCARLNLSRSTVYALSSDGDIPAVRVGKVMRWRVVDIERYIDGLELVRAKGASASGGEA